MEPRAAGSPQDRACAAFTPTSRSSRSRLALWRGLRRWRWRRSDRCGKDTLRRIADASLTNTLAKLARADEHLRALDAEAREFAGRDPYSVTSEGERDSDGSYVARLEIREWPPLRLGVILGDVLYQWRSALDNLIPPLIRLNKQTAGRRHRFPVFDDEGRYKAVGVKLIAGVSKKHAAIIESFQPHPGRTDATIAALALVNEHCNADKHAAIHPTFGAFTNPEEAARNLRREPITAEFQLRFDPVGFGKPLEDGMEVARITPIGEPPETKPKLYVDLPAEIAFGERGLALNALPAIRWHIHAIVGRFQPDFD